MPQDPYASIATADPYASIAVVDQAAQPQSALDRFAARLPGSSNDTGLRGAVHHLGDTYNAVVKPLVDIGPYGIAHAMYEKAQGQPAEIQALPRKMMEQGTMMLAGGIDAPEAEPGAAAQPASVATAPADASEGMLGRALKVLMRKASGYIPGMHTAKEIAAIPKDLDYVLNGPATTAEQATAAKAVPEIWGKGKYGSPVDQWGQRIEPTPAPAQSGDPLDRLRNQEYPPAQPDYPAERPSIERIMPEKSAGQAGSMAESVASEPPVSNFPPSKPKGKFQYDPSRIPPRYQPPPTFDTTGITRDVDEDNAIEDAVRADLQKHGTITRMQGNREFAARNSMDTPKGVLQAQAANTKAAPALIDAGAPTLGSPVEPIEFLNGAKGYKTAGRWFLRDNEGWRGVNNAEMKQAVTAGTETSASSEQESQDLLDKLNQMNDIVQALRAKKGK